MAAPTFLPSGIRIRPLSQGGARREEGQGSKALRGPEGKAGGEGTRGFITRTANGSELQSNKDMRGILKFGFENVLTTPMIKNRSETKANDLCVLALTPKTDG